MVLQRRWILAALILIPTLATPSLVWAESRVADVPDGQEWDPVRGVLVSDVLERDAAVAAAAGADFDVTLGRLRAQADMDRAVTVLEAAYPDTFGGLYWADGLVVVALFKGTTPDGALATLDSIGVSVVERRAMYSAKELGLLGDDVRAALSAIGVAEAAVGIDPREQRVVTTVPRAGSRGASESDLTSAVNALTDAPVELSVVDGPAARPLTVYGGGELWKDFQTFTCTTGFTVVSGATTGTATAGHCNLSPGYDYWDPYTAAHHDLTYQNGNVGYWGDFQWFTTTGAEVDDFYYGNYDARRDVSAVKNTFSVGDPLYFYGRKSQTQYYSTVGWIGISDGSASNLVCLYSGMGQEGDSGGPVFYGTTAAGYITSLVPIGGADRMCFSQARYIDDAIGVSIKTN